MFDFIPLPLDWIEQRNAENWVIENSDLIETLKEASRTVVEVFKFLKGHGYANNKSIRKNLKNGEQCGVLHRTAKYSVHHAKIEVTDFGLELYTMMFLGGMLEGM